MNDIDLKEVMDEIGAAAPVMPERMRSVLDESRALAARAGELDGLLATLKGQAVELKESLGAELAGHADRAATREGELRGELAELEAGAEAFAAIAPEVEAAGAAFVGLLERMQELTASLDGDAGTMRELDTALRTRVQELLTTAAANADVLEQRLAQVGEAIGTLEGALAEAREEVTARFGELDELIEEKSAEVRAGLDTFLGGARMVVDALGGGLDDILEQIVRAKVGELIDDVKERVLTQLKGLVDEAVGALVEVMEDLREKVRESEGSAAEARQLLEPIFERVDFVKEPIERAVEAVKDAADSVGISFG